MSILPVDRALNLYGTLANRSETKGARERLSRHLMDLYLGGEKDEHRLTVQCNRQRHHRRRTAPAHRAPLVVPLS
jgi:hypothetical protein